MSSISRHWRACSIALIILLACWTFWPGLRSFFYLDDFFLTAIARLLDNPFAPFAHNHFPGGYFYRPLTISFWWLSVAVLGHTPMPQYVLNMLLHVAISIAFWRLLCAWTYERVGPLLAALTYALHPIAIGTSLWLSDRFDLLAILFGIFAMHGAWRFRVHGSMRAFILTCLCLTLSILSKEIGFASAAPIVAIWLWPSDSVRPSRPARVRALIAIIMLAIALLAWRAFILGGALDTRHVGDGPITQIVLDGLLRWISRFFAYLLAIQRMPLISLIAEIAGVATLAGLGLLGLVRARAQWRSEKVQLAIAALALLLATGVLQAPTLRFMLLDSSATTTAATATEGRVFCYSLLAGVTLIFALCRLAIASQTAPGRARVALAAAIFCLLPWMIDAHHLAKQYRRDTYVQKHLLLAAQAAIDKLPLSSRCSVFLLGVEGDQDFPFAMQADAAMKALTTDLARIAGCRFTSARAPWFFVLRRDSVTPLSAAPMRPVLLDGEPVPWLAFGGVEVAYLNLFDGIDAKAMTDAHFLSYDGDKFNDVTQDVLAGRREVKFRCGRRREQCAQNS